MKYLKLIALILALSGILYAQNGYPNDLKGNVDLGFKEDIYGTSQIDAIKGWGLDSPSAGVKERISEMPKSISREHLGQELAGIKGSSGLGELFTLLQGKYFALIFFLVILLVPLAFYGHYKLVGPKIFDHHGIKLQVFNRYNILVHWLAATPFILLCLTGLAMVFGDKLGGGWLVRFCRDLHGIATVFFAIFGTLMFLMWVKDALFRLYDIRWFAIMGGYLTQDRFPIPAGKFNAGQKMWFWIATIGGGVMVFSGAMMFFQSSDINTLRLMAIGHNVVGFLIVAMLITHIYMAIFAIEGAFGAIVDGKMSEEEVAILHSFYYKELESKDKLSDIRVH